MDEVLGAGVSGWWWQVLNFMELVTKVFGCIIAKGRGLSRWELRVMFICLGATCLWVGVGYEVGVVCLVIWK
jgi:hypothetical protein